MKWYQFSLKVNRNLRFVTFTRCHVENRECCIHIPHGPWLRMCVRARARSELLNTEVWLGSSWNSSFETHLKMVGECFVLPCFSYGGFCSAERLVRADWSRVWCVRPWADREGGQSGVASVSFSRLSNNGTYGLYSLTPHLHQWNVCNGTYHQFNPLKSQPS